MDTTAEARHEETTKSGGTLYMALELGEQKWKLGFTNALAQKARRRTVAARDRAAVGHEIARAKQRFGLAADAPVVSCYEAGRDGFWLDRWLTALGVANVVVDSASIQVDRRARRAKSDGLDVQALLTLLVRHAGGEPKVWSVVHVPTAEVEDTRQAHRELATLKQERTRGRNRIRGLLAAQGVTLRGWTTARAELERLRTWAGQPLGVALRARLERDLARLEVLEQQIRTLAAAQRRSGRTAAAPDSALAMIQRLAGVRGIGIPSATVLVHEAFGWRRLHNRREVGALLGLTPTPYQSGTLAHEQGISKAGNVWIRRLAVELAWLWLIWQPESELSRWYQRRFGQGSARQRRLGIVALARKLMIALWRYADTGELPAGAVLKAAGPAGRAAA